MKGYGFYLIIILGLIRSQNFHYHEDDWYILRHPGSINAMTEDNFSIHFATENGVFSYDKSIEDFRYNYLTSLEFKFSHIRHMIYDNYRDYYWVVHSKGISYKSSVSSIWLEMSLYNSGIFSYYQIDDIGVSPNYIWLRSMNEMYPFDPFSANNDVYYCEDYPDDLEEHESCLNVEEGIWYLDDSEKCTPCDGSSVEPENNSPVSCENNIWIELVW